jgi:hypothetical protein
MAKLSELGPPIIGKRHGGGPKDDRDNLIVCPTCRQTVDLRDFRQVMWHETPGHEPLEPDA